MNATNATSESDDFISVKEAAGILHLHPSSIWRLIDAGTLPATRFGRRKLMIRRGDLEPAVAAPTHSLRRRELTDSERRKTRAVLDELATIRQQIFEEHGSRLFPPSWQVLDEIRGMADEPDYDGELVDRH